MAKGIKTGGRTKGAVNKTTTEIREHFQNLVSENLEQLNEDLKSLEPLQRLKMIIDIAKFVVPTLKATDLTIDKENGFSPIVINLGNGISPEDIRRLDAELEAKY
jgi:predicted AAA+ superfamily ATPase